MKTYQEVEKLAGPFISNYAVKERGKSAKREFKVEVSI